MMWSPSDSVLTNSEHSELRPLWPSCATTTIFATSSATCPRTRQPTSSIRKHATMNFIPQCKLSVTG